MTIEAIGAMNSVGVTDMVRSTAIAPGGTAATDFMHVLDAGLSRVNESLTTADAQLRGLAGGEDIAIHDVMVSMEKARVDLMLVAEVRNRLVEAYQELTRMQL
jgi:flagellar hook-basal body complex protein FliE